MVFLTGQTGPKPTRVVQLFFLAALFVVPFSTALTNLFGALVFIAFPFAWYADKELRHALRSTPSWLVLALFALLLVGIAWSIAPASEIAHAVGKYRKLLLLPIGIALTTREPDFGRRALISFLAGATVLALASYLAKFGILPVGTPGLPLLVDPQNAVVFKNHITTGVLLGAAAAMCVGYAFVAAAPRERLRAVAAGIFFAVPIVFYMQGRTGYVALFVGMAALIVRRYRGNFKRLLAGILVLASAFAAFYATSGNFRQRADQAVLEVRNFYHATEMSAGDAHLTSNGIRLTFLHGGLQLVAKHPVLGSGTGSFQEGFAPIAKSVWPEGHPFHLARHQPHNDYLLIAVQLGALGLILYLSLFASLMAAVRKNRAYAADNLTVLLAIFMTTSLFNSLLWDFTEGHWFVLLAGCLYAACRNESARA